MMDDLVALGRVFAYLSMMTLGGGIAIYPELNKLVVDGHGWLTLPQLDYLYGVGQAAPGPNLMVVSVGALTAGLPGALSVLVAFVGPPAFLTFLVGRVWSKLKRRPWFVATQRGLAPVSIGLLLAGCLTFAKGALTGWTTVLIGAVVFLVVLRTNINPAAMVLAGAVAGILAFGLH